MNPEEEFRKELKALLQKYNAEIYAHTVYEDSNQVEISIDLNGKEILSIDGNNGLSYHDL